MIELPADHPGFADPLYRARRGAIAEVSASQAPGALPPLVDYRPDEDHTWHLAATALAPLHDAFAVAEYRAAATTLDLPRDRVPQLADVSQRLTALTGWRVEAVPGLVPTRQFYGSLAERTFLSTQYVRHGSTPFYTPEPDIIHELIGHVNALASPHFAALYEVAGAASRRATSDAALERFSKVFWFTIEFGVTFEGDELRTYGAGLLSSYGEIQAFRDAEVRPFDVEAMAVADYDITKYQGVLYAAPSFDEMRRDLTAYFESL